MKTIFDPQGNKQTRFATMQEAARKDVERAFEVLQTHWGIVRVSCDDVGSRDTLVAHNMLRNFA